MSDERIAQLSELAAKAYPELEGVRVRYDVNHDEWPEACVVFCAKHLDGCDAVLSEIRHPRALDALEATLRVLASADANDRPVEAFKLDQLIGPEGVASLLPDVRKALEAFLGFENGCFESMRHNCQRMRGQCKRERDRAEAAERELAGLRLTLPGPLPADYGAKFKADAFELVEKYLRSLGRTVEIMIGNDTDDVVHVQALRMAGWKQGAGASLLESVDAMKGDGNV